MFKFFTGFSLKSIALAIAGAFLSVVLIVSARRKDKIEDLEDYIEYQEVKGEADAVRMRPVPTDKHDILDRM